MFTKAQIIKQINKCGNLAWKHREATELLNEMFVEVYGMGYSDMDANVVIEVADYGGVWKGGIKALDEEVSHCIEEDAHHKHN